MSARDIIVPLAVTYAPSGGASTTVTVLGQVLDNGQTNWIPSGSHALYLAPASAPGDGRTVVAGSTYYLRPGPAVPNQATGQITVTGAAASSAATPNSTPAQTSAAPTEEASSPSAATSSSSTSGAAPVRAWNHVRGRMAYALVVVWVVGVVAM